MELNLEALIGMTYLAPIALTLRKVYSPDFDVPDAFLRVLGKLDTAKMNPRFVSHFKVTPQAASVALR